MTEANAGTASGSMSGELALYAAQIGRLIDHLCAVVEGLNGDQLNWRPPGAEMNSVYVIATHVLGNAEGWILGSVCGQDVRRNRAAEFEAAGVDAAPLVANARDVARRIDDALGSLPPGALDETRDFPGTLAGANPPPPRTVRDALMLVVAHAATHLGHIDVTRDLALASEAGS
jgi:hypothetical protein